MITVGNGEQSRFISQLELLRDDIKYRTVSPIIPKDKVSLKSITKTNDVIHKLKKRAEKGFSPSAIGSYLYNPIDFYKQKVLGLDEKDEVEETLAANTMGNIVHKALEELYMPYLNTYLEVEDIDSMEKLVKKKIDVLFPKYYKKGNFSSGKNKLIYEIVLSYITRFLQQEKHILKKGNTLKVLEVEKKIEALFHVNEFDFPIKLYGEIDRIDELNGQLRIVDYKTGFVTSSHMKIPEVWNLNDYKHSKAIQVLMYAYMFQESYPKTYESIIAGNISFKKLKDGFLPITFSKEKETKRRITKEKLELFKESLGDIFKEIFDINIPFVEREK